MSNIRNYYFLHLHRLAVHNNSYLSMQYNYWVPLIDLTVSINTSPRRKYRKRYIDNFNLQKKIHYMSARLNNRCLYVSTCSVNPCGGCKISEFFRSRYLFKLDFSKFFQENDCNRAEITKCIDSKWDDYGRWGTAVNARIIMATFVFLSRNKIYII